MKGLQDTRYKGDGVQTTATETLIFPLWIQVERPSHQAAVREARAVVEQLEKEAAQFVVKGATLKVGELSQRQQQKVSDITLEQQGRDEVKLELNFFLLLKFEAGGSFWERAELIAQHIDFIQKFCQKFKDKHLIVATDKAQFPLSTVEPVSKPTVA